MKALMIAALAAVGALAVAAPANADPHWRSGYGQDRGYVSGYDDGRFSPDAVYRLEQRLAWGARSGALTRREAAYLYDQLWALKARARFYWNSDGISWRERQELDARYSCLRDDLRRELRDGDRRWDGDRDERYEDHDGDGPRW